MIASGGAAGPADFVARVRDGGADAVLAASIFHRRIHSIGEVKAAMAAAGLPVRPDDGRRGMTATPRAVLDAGSVAWPELDRPACPASSRTAPTAAS